MPCMPRATNELELSGGPAQGKSVYCRRSNTTNRASQPVLLHKLTGVTRCKSLGQHTFLETNLGGMTWMCMSRPMQLPLHRSLELSRTVTIDFSP